MTFAWPLVLLALIVPAAGGWLMVRQRNRGATGGKNGSPNILTAEAGTTDLRLGAAAPRARRPGPWLCAGLALAVVAMARPQWGHVEEPNYQRSREILIALDLSRSMLTPDVPPSRLERAKLLIQSLLDHLQGERVGLVTFAGTAFLQAPLSADYEMLREFLPQLGPNFLPEGGTNYGAMLQTATAAFSGTSDADRFLVVLSDGGATDDDWEKSLPPLIDKGVRVIGLGIGTAAGGFIPDGSGGFLKDERGAVVLAKLESGTLQTLAAKSHGLYRDAADWVDVAALVRATIDAGRKGSFTEQSSSRPIERFQWALAPALVCFLISFWREFPVRAKPRDLRWTAAAAGLLLAAAGVAVPGALHAADPSAALPPQELLGNIVKRLASSPTPPSALDWAELARQTVTWGQGFVTGQQAVPKGPVNDALSAVAAGRALGPRSADWDQLESELRDLLKPPPPPPKQQQQKNQQQNQQQNPQDQNQQQPKSQDDNRSPEDKKPEQSQQQPQPQQQNLQQVGGQNDQPQHDPAREDPSLAGPMEQLDRVRNQDAPAQLFRMLARQNPPPKQEKKNNKDW